LKHRGHSRKENLIAILTGTFIVAQGVFFLQQAHLLTGGTTGLALLLTHFVDFSFGQLYFVINIPFYIMAWCRRFALSSICCGALVSVMTDNLHHFVELSQFDRVYCAVMGGMLMGLGMLILFRHNTSLGGFNVLVLYLQEKFGVSAGKLQMGIDIAILVCSYVLMTPAILMLSLLGAVMLNLVLAMNHKPGRYNDGKAVAQATD